VPPTAGVSRKAAGGRPATPPPFQDAPSYPSSSQTSPSPFLIATPFAGYCAEEISVCHRNSRNRQNPGRGCAAAIRVMQEKAKRLHWWPRPESKQPCRNGHVGVVIVFFPLVEQHSSPRLRKLLFGSAPPTAVCVRPCASPSARTPRLRIESSAVRPPVRRRPKPRLSENQEFLCRKFHGPCSPDFSSRRYYFFLPGC